MKVECQLLTIVQSSAMFVKNVRVATTVKGRREGGAVALSQLWHSLEGETISHKISFVVDNHKTEQKNC